MAKNKTKTKSHKTKKSRKSKKVVEPVVVPVVVSEPVVEVAAPEPVVEESVSVVESTIASITGKVTELYAAMKELKAELKTLQQQWKKETKELKKKKKKRGTSGKKRAPSGFAKPAVISNKLCDFLGVDHGTEMARTEVTKFLTNYIKTHNLQNPSNRKQIKPDKKLKSILGPLSDLDKEKGYTYFNLQRYVKNHFPKSKSASKSA